MSRSDRVLADAEAVLRRHSERGQSLTARARQRRNAGLIRKVKYAFWAVLAVILGSAVAGFVVPLGTTGVMIVVPTPSLCLSKWDSCGFSLTAFIS